MRSYDPSVGPPRQILPPRENRSHIRHSHKSPATKNHTIKGSKGGTWRRENPLLLHGSLDDNASSPIINCCIFITISTPIFHLIPDPIVVCTRFIPLP